MPTITVSDVTQEFLDTIALKSLSLTLEGDQIVGLLGRNGSGKSTLLSIMAGFRKPTNGQVLLDGEPVFENPAAMEQIALIREAGDTIDASEKVGEALRYASFFRPNWDDAFAEQILERFEVSRKSRLNELSLGKRSAVGIALGLASRAPITILDETYLGLDAPSRYAFYDIVLKDFMRRPRTYILSSHLIEEVGRLLSDVVIIDQGKVIVHNDAETLRNHGSTVSGPLEKVDAFVDGMEVIGRKVLGRTGAAMVMGPQVEELRASARSHGLHVDPVDLQDLFVYLTDPKASDF